DTIYKLNTVSETISEMAKCYNEVAVASIDENANMVREARKAFVDSLFNNMEELTDNILYEDLIYQDDILADNIYDILEEQDAITKEELIQVLEANNSYIIGIDSEDEFQRKVIEKDISIIVKTINDTYKVNKFNQMWKQKEASNKKVLANQLSGVAKVLSSVAENADVGADEPVCPDGQSRPSLQFKIQIGVARVTKNKSEISGDSSIQTKLVDGKYMLAISDGMGSRTKC
ncbi:MAG: hypothetical protein FWC68_01910, partial [Oscillospiraceae bacterium]|nr:hypothetical protein [Oscillospiraceae bacterium]